MKKGSLSQTVVSVVLTLVMIGVVIGVMQANGIISMETAMDKAKSTAAHYAECIPAGDCGLLSILGDIKPSDLIVPGIDNPNIPTDNQGKDLILNIPYEERSVSRDKKGYKGPTEGEPYVNNVGIIKKELITKMLDDIEIIDENVEEGEETQQEGKDEIVTKDYSRIEWKHWISINDSCWNSREEILFRDAVPGSVMLLNKQMEKTTEIGDACAIGFLEEKDGKRRINTENSGEWIDPYSKDIITSSSDVDIDHVVPLSYAHKNGGQAWTAELKEKFANDPDNLLATSAKENRSKGDKGPAKYMPKTPYKCQYAKTFTSVIYKYGLKLTESDKKSLEKAIRTCQY